MKKAIELTEEELRGGIYVPAINGCYLYKQMIEEGESYQFDEKFKSKILGGKLDYSFELVKNNFLLENIEVEEWLRGRKKFFYSLDIVNVKFDKSYKCKFAYVEISKIKDDKIVEDTFLNYRASKESLLVKDYKVRNGEEEFYFVKLKAGAEVKVIEYINGFVKIEVSLREYSSKQLRRYLYKNGFSFNNNSFSNWKRSSGKARIGNCLFIKSDIKDKVLAWSRMGLNFNGKQDIAGIRAYESLPLSSIIGTIKIDPNKILVIDDYESRFKTIMSKTYLEDGKCKVIEDEVEECNSIWDGQGLLNQRIFDENEILKGKGMALLRNRFMKCAGFSCRIQDFFEDNYEGDTVKDMYGNEIKISDIDLITTPSAIKLIKFNDEVLKLDNYKDLGSGAWLKYWKDNCGDEFGVCKTDKKSHIDNGERNRLSYQMINSMPLTRDNIKELLKDEFKHIELLRSDLDYYLKYGANLNTEFKGIEEDFNEDSEMEIGRGINVISAFNELVKRNPDFKYTKVIKDQRRNYINSYIEKLRQGKIKIEGDYCTICGNPIEMLYSVIGKFNGQAIALKGWEIYSSRFNDGEKVIGFRNPHISSFNIGKHINKKVNDIEKYFTCTPNIVFINAIDEAILSTYNGADFDSDTILLTNNKIIVEACENVDSKIPQNSIEAIKVKREITPDNMSDVDHVISQNMIGQVVNTSQLTASYLNNELNKNEGLLDTKTLIDWCSMLSSISNCEIDKAKKNFESLNITKELNNIKEILPKVCDIYPDDKEDRRIIKPLFFKHIGDTAAQNMQKVTNKKELENRIKSVVEKYIKENNLTKEEVLKAGKVNKDHIELIKSLDKVKEEWKMWCSKIYVSFDTPMDYLQDVMDEIASIKTKKTKNILLGDYLKEVKHKADKDEINELAKRFNELNKKLTGVALSNINKKEKYIAREELKEELATYLRDKKLTKVKLYHLLRKLLRTNKNSKVVNSHMESLCIEIMFRAYGDKFIEMFKMGEN